MKKLIVILCLCLIIWGCKQNTDQFSNHDIKQFKTPFSTSTLIIGTENPTKTPVPTYPQLVSWPLEFTVYEPYTGMEYPENACNNIYKIHPGESTLEDVFDVLGYPAKRVDYKEGIVLGYPTHHMKFSNIVLINPHTQIVDFIAIVGCYKNEFTPECDTWQCYVNKHGEPIRAITNFGVDHMFFEGAGLALLMHIKSGFSFEDTYPNFPPIQYFSPDLTIDEYINYGGFFFITYAFTP